MTARRLAITPRSRVPLTAQIPSVSVPVAPCCTARRAFLHSNALRHVSIRCTNSLRLPAFVHSTRGTHVFALSHLQDFVDCFLMSEVACLLVVNITCRDHPCSVTDICIDTPVACAPGVPCPQYRCVPSCKHNFVTSFVCILTVRPGFSCLSTEMSMTLTSTLNNVCLSWCRLHERNCLPRMWFSLCEDMRQPNPCVSPWRVFVRPL